jgi:broad specificity phosphatase PhoE
VRVGRALTSDRRRARETADIVLGDRDVARTETRDLRERDYGSWEGLSDDDVEARFGAELARMLAGRGEGADDAEPQAGMIARVLGAVRRLCADHPDEVVLVVAHSGPVRAIHAAAAGLDLASLPGALPEAEHCSVAWFHADGNGTVRRIDGIGEAP